MLWRLIDLDPTWGLWRLMLRLPICLYRAHLGWLLGERFLLLTHLGRKTGLPRQTVLEVVRKDAATDTFFVASGWGEKANWFRNIQQTPEVIVQVGRRRLAALATRLTEAEAERELRDYAARYPRAFRFLASLIAGQHLSHTEADFRTLAQSFPLVALRPRDLMP